MSGAKAAKKKLSFWETLRAASGSYGRLYGYVKPYKARFITGLVLGLAYGGVNSLFPCAIARLTSTIFYVAARNPIAVRHTLGNLLWLRWFFFRCVCCPFVFMAGARVRRCRTNRLAWPRWS